MDETIISWNVTNWITVMLMVFVGLLVIGAFGFVAKKFTGAGSSGGQQAASLPAG